MSKLGNIIHELGHIIGFFHEHSRSDRDNYIKINLANVKEGNQDQYRKYEDGNIIDYGVKYDLFSIMHYSGSDGVISSIDQNLQFLMGQRVGLSFLDIEKANKAYRCSSKSN